MPLVWGGGDWAERDERDRGCHTADADADPDWRTRHPWKEPPREAYAYAHTDALTLLRMLSELRKRGTR